MNVTCLIVLEHTRESRQAGPVANIRFRENKYGASCSPAETPRFQNNSAQRWSPLGMCGTLTHGVWYPDPRGVKASRCHGVTHARRKRKMQEVALQASSIGHWRSCPCQGEVTLRLEVNPRSKKTGFPLITVGPTDWGCFLHSFSLSKCQNVFFFFCHLKSISSLTLINSDEQGRRRWTTDHQFQGAGGCSHS